jgi:glyoxylase-like metal-dependent hydrolase (beta-lactamase superfamily II)
MRPSGLSTEAVQRAVRVNAPRHTPGSAVLHFRSLGALLIGDAFATYAVTTGARGPGIAPFTADAPQALDSLTRIEDVSSDIVLPGHGDPWTGSVEEAVRLVRKSAAWNVQD